MPRLDQENVIGFLLLTLILVYKLSKLNACLLLTPILFPIFCGCMKIVLLHAKLSILITNNIQHLCKLAVIKHYGDAFEDFLRAGHQKSSIFSACKAQGNPRGVL